VPKTQIFSENNVDKDQGDKIGRIFAQWVNVYFGQFFENRGKWLADIFGDFSTVKFMHSFGRKCSGLHFGRLFSPTHLVTLAMIQTK
jgi:hypothetical protein